MLHPVPNSKHRDTLLLVVELQQQLLTALCALPEGTTVDLVWLQNLWEAGDAGWARRFWENDLEKRSKWIKRIAAAPAADKKAIRNLAAEQLRFPEVYNDPPTMRLSRHEWGNEPLSSLKNLLKSFYSPYFYSDEGYGAPCAAEGQNFTKDTFILGFPGGGPKVCPYCDNNTRNLELDHFLPQDEFPLLSCHPDNLIPSCHDCNSITEKGTKVPLSLNAPVQAADRFHPRRRSAWQKIRVAFYEDAEHQPQMRLEPVDPADARRVEKLEWLFGLASFWGRHTKPDIQHIGSEVSDLLRADGLPASP